MPGGRGILQQGTEGLPLQQTAGSRTLGLSGVDSVGLWATFGMRGVTMRTVGDVRKKRPWGEGAILKCVFPKVSWLLCWHQTWLWEGEVEAERTGRRDSGRGDVALSGVVQGKEESSAQETRKQNVSRAWYWTVPGSEAEGRGGSHLTLLADGTVHRGTCMGTSGSSWSVCHPSRWGISAGRWDATQLSSKATQPSCLHLSRPFVLPVSSLWTAGTCWTPECLYLCGFIYSGPGHLPAFDALAMCKPNLIPSLVLYLQKVILWRWGFCLNFPLFKFKLQIFSWPNFQSLWDSKRWQWQRN